MFIISVKKTCYTIVIETCDGLLKVMIYIYDGIFTSRLGHEILGLPGRRLSYIISRSSISLSGDVFLKLHINLPSPTPSFTQGNNFLTNAFCKCYMVESCVSMYRCGITPKLNVLNFSN